MSRSFFDKLATSRAVSLTGLLSLIFAAGGWGWAWWVLRERPHSLIIHFNNLVHVNLSGSVEDLAGIGAFGVLAVLVNTLVALELDERDWFWGKFLAAATLAFSVLIFIGFAAIMSVN